MAAIQTSNLGFKDTAACSEGLSKHKNKQAGSPTDTGGNLTPTFSSTMIRTFHDWKHRTREPFTKDLGLASLNLPHTKFSCWVCRTDLHQFSKRYSLNHSVIPCIATT